MSPTSHDIIVAMLRSYQDVCGPGDRGEGSGEVTEDRLLLMNPLWTQGSFPELTRCLVAMRAEEQQLYWHTAERYLRLRRKQVRDHCPVCMRPTDTVHTHHIRGLTQRFKPTDVMLEVWHPRVDPRLVDRGVDWLVDCHRGPPFLPSELYAMVAA